MFELIIRETKIFLQLPFFVAKRETKKKQVCQVHIYTYV